VSQKQNCWEVMKCERQVGGAQVKDLGVCSAAIEESANGINGGYNGGRLCWAIAGTLCGGKKQGTFAEKRKTCMMCEFYSKVFKEQGAQNFQMQHHCPYQ